MLQTVSGNHRSMGWPWDGRPRIISFTPMRCDGAHLSSAGVFKHSLLYHEKLPHRMFGTAKWPYSHFGSTVSPWPDTASGFFYLNVKTFQRLGLIFSSICISHPFPGLSLPLCVKVLCCVNACEYMQSRMGAVLWPAWMDQHPGPLFHQLRNTAEQL